MQINYFLHIISKSKQGHPDFSACICCSIQNNTTPTPLYPPGPSTVVAPQPPPTPPNTSHISSMDTWLIHRLEASPAIIISVCQACATLPGCQAWERACPLSLSLLVFVPRISMGLHIIWLNDLENVLETGEMAPERTGDSYICGNQANPKTQHFC